MKKKEITQNCERESQSGGGKKEGKKKKKKTSGGGFAVERVRARKAGRKRGGYASYDLGQNWFILTRRNAWGQGTSKDRAKLSKRLKRAARNQERNVAKESTTRLFS